MPADETTRKSPIEIYYSYASTGRDEELRHELERHLKILELSGRIAGWHRGEIRAGSVHARERSTHLERAGVILLLISPDFMASEEAYGIEMKRALERQESGEARVIPILLRPVFYTGAPFAHLTMLPSNGKPITSWPQRDEAFENVAQGINLILDDLTEKKKPEPSTPSAPPSPTPSSGSKYEIHMHGPAHGIVIGDNNTVTQKIDPGKTP